MLQEENENIAEKVCLVLFPAFLLFTNATI